MKKERSLLSLTILFLVVTSCTTNILDVDISGISVQTELINADELLKLDDLERIKLNHNNLQNDLGYIYSYELEMNLRTPLDSSVAEKIMKFYGSEYMIELEQEKAEILNKIKEKHTETIKGFRYFNYHFPNETTPQKIVLINKLFSGIKANDSILTIAPENYLNPELPVVKNLPGDMLYQWQKDGMNVDYLPRDILQFWIQAKLFNDIDENLASHILQAGKVIYILHACFPKNPYAYALRYTHENYKWAEENEFAFWEYLVKEELLFKNNLRDKTNFLNEGPYTLGLPEQGPDRLGQYLGFKMVLNYMSNNKDLSLPELLELNYNTILQAYEID
jgi:hypothetical protein